MKNAYRMFKRRNRPYYYIQNNSTGEQKSLGTTDKEEAKKLLDAHNDARQSPALNLHLGTVYLTHADPEMASRTWQSTLLFSLSGGPRTGESTTNDEANNQWQARLAEKELESYSMMNALHNVAPCLLLSRCHE